MENFLISFIEDNHIGVFEKQIIVECKNIKECFDTYYEKYPTLLGIQKYYGEYPNYLYTHKGQDELALSKKDNGEQLKISF